MCLALSRCGGGDRYCKRTLRQSSSLPGLRWGRLAGRLAPASHRGRASPFGRECAVLRPSLASPSGSGNTHIALGLYGEAMQMRLNAAMQMLMPLQKRSMRTVPHVRQVSTSLLRLLTALRSCTSPFPTVRLTCPKPFFVSPVALSAVLQLGLRICVHGDGVTRSGRASRPVLPRQIAQLGRSFEHEHMASRPRPNHWRALRSPCRRCRLRPTICCVCVV